MAAPNRISGKVKWFNVKKGYGFITPSTGGEDIFVHQTAIHAEGFRSLAENEEVFFEISENGGKSKAVNVTGPGGAFVQGAPRRARAPRGGPRGGGGRGPRKDGKPGEGGEAAAAPSAEAAKA